jgi:hypothetical protein
MNIKSPNYFHELKFLGNTKAPSNTWGCNICQIIPLCGVALLQNYFNIFFSILPHWHPPIQPLTTASIFSLILKIIQISLLAEHLKEVVTEKSFIYHTFVGSHRICFTPGFPVKGPKFGVVFFYPRGCPCFWSTVTFLGACFTFTALFFSWHNFCFSHKIVHFHWKMSSGTSEKLSDNNSGRIRSSLICIFAH